VPLIGFDDADPWLGVSRTSDAATDARDEYHFSNERQQVLIKR
jgi:hypothetical protein